MRAEYERISRDYCGTLDQLRDQIVAIVLAMKAAEAERDEAVRALAFAASVIKSGEPWTETCDREIGRVLYKEGAG